jgi:hypothetical protein
MISPETAPFPSFFAVYLRVVEFVAEGEVVRPQIHEPVVLPELRRRHALDADQRAHPLLHGLHVRGHEVEVLAALIPRVEVDEGDVGLRSGGPGHLDHVLQVLVGHLVHADVGAGGAEAAVHRGVRVPVRARVRDVDAEVGPLEHPHLAHLGTLGGPLAVPVRLDRDAHRILGPVPLVADEILRAALEQPVRRIEGEILLYRDVHPDVLSRTGKDQLEAGPEPGPDAGHLPGVLF